MLLELNQAMIPLVGLKYSFIQQWNKRNELALSIARKKNKGLILILTLIITHYISLVFGTPQLRLELLFIHKPAYNYPAKVKM